MPIPPFSTVAAAGLLTASAVLLFRSRAIVAHLAIWHQLAALWHLARAFLPAWFLTQLVAARWRGRSTRLVRKRYRSLRRRALRRAVTRFFAAAEPTPEQRTQFAASLACALAGGAILLAVGG
jgi:hypothetical protein